jgi:hypothetical protein
MKKKLALLLAVVMILGITGPINLTANILVRNTVAVLPVGGLQSYGSDTALIDAQLLGGATPVASILNGPQIANNGAGLDLLIMFDSFIDVGTNNLFRVDLTNAEFNFRPNGVTIPLPVGNPTNVNPANGLFSNYNRNNFTATNISSGRGDLRDNRAWRVETNDTAANIPGLIADSDLRTRLGAIYTAMETDASGLIAGGDTVHSAHANFGASAYRTLLRDAATPARWPRETAPNYTDQQLSSELTAIAAIAPWLYEQALTRVANEYPEWWGFRHYATGGANVGQVATNHRLTFNQRRTASAFVATSGPDVIFAAASPFSNPTGPNIPANVATMNTLTTYIAGLDHIIAGTATPGSPSDSFSITLPATVVTAVNNIVAAAALTTAPTTDVEAYNREWGLSMNPSALGTVTDPGASVVITWDGTAWRFASPLERINVMVFRDFLKEAVEVNTQRLLATDAAVSVIEGEILAAMATIAATQPAVTELKTLFDALLDDVDAPAPGEPFVRVEATGNSYVTFARYPLLAAQVNATPGKIINYVMDIDDNWRGASVRILDDAEPGDYLVIPLVIMTVDREQPVLVHAGGIALGGNVEVRQLSPGGVQWGTTSTRFNTVTETARGRVLLDDLIITESNGNVIQSGWFAIIPPRGFNLRAIDTSGDATGIPRGMAGSGNVRGVRLQTATRGMANTRLLEVVSFLVREINVSHYQPRAAMALRLDVSANSAIARTEPGTLTFRGLVLEPIELDTDFWTHDFGDTLEVLIRPFRFVTSGESNANNPMNSGTRARWHANCPFYSAFDIFTWDGPTIGTNVTAGQRTSTATSSRAVLYGNLADVFWFNPGAGGNSPEGSGFAGREFNNFIINVPTHRTPIVSATGAIGAQREQWGISFTGGTPTNLYSGRINQQAATVSVRASSRDSWNIRGRTMFTLMEEVDGKMVPSENVKITRVVVADIATNMLRVGGGAFRNLTFWNRDITVDADTSMHKTGSYNSTPMNYHNASFGREGNNFTVSDLYQPNDRSMPRLDLTFHLSANPNFSGTVYLNISGGGIEDRVNNPILSDNNLPIARFERPLIIEAEPTDVQIGYLIYDVAPIKLVENVFAFDGTYRRVLSAQDRITLEIGAFGRRIDRDRNPIQFNPINARDFTTEGEANNPFRVTNVATIQGRHLLTIARQGNAATAQPGSINLHTLTVDIDRTVPWGDYDLLVSIESTTQEWRDNFLRLSPGQSFNWLYDRFDVWGMTIIAYDEDGKPYNQPYVRMVTLGDSPQTVQQVRIRAWEYHAEVDGREVPIVDDLGVPLNIQINNDRLYVPLRFISEILGVPHGNIIWDGAQQTVTILTVDGRTIQFVVGSDVFWINGAQISTWELGYNGAGTTAPPMIDPLTGRTYVPFRALGQALGIEVDWDPVTQQGIYNTRGMILTPAVVTGNGE